MRGWMTSLLDLLGIVCIVVGVAMWWPPAAWVVCGVLIVAFSVREASRRPPAKSEPPS